MAAAIEKGRSRRGFLLWPFSTAAAAGGRNSCRTSENFAAIGALLYDAAFSRCFRDFSRCGVVTLRPGLVLCSSYLTLNLGP